MSTASDNLRRIEQRAERAIPQELRLMSQEVLEMRHALVLDDRAHADALLMKLDRLIDDQVIRPCAAPETPQMLPQLDLDDLLPLSPSNYVVRFFHREYGDLEDVATVESFPQAVQLAVDRLAVHPMDQTDAGWANGRGTLSVRSQHGTVLLHIEAIEQPLPTVQPHVARACQALESGDAAHAGHLFTALRQVA